VKEMHPKSPNFIRKLGSFNSITDRAKLLRQFSGLFCFFVEAQRKDGLTMRPRTFRPMFRPNTLTL
jgi:hypothetical protein